MGWKREREGNERGTDRILKSKGEGNMWRKTGEKIKRTEEDESQGERMANGDNQDDD